MNELLTKDTKLYAERDVIDQMQHYVNHVEAMTAEGLHSKSDIAAELAHRDIQIEELQRDVARWKNAHQVVMIERDSFKGQAEMNRDTIKEMQHQRDSVHDELVHLQNAPRSFR